MISGVLAHVGIQRVLAKPKTIQNPNELGVHFTALSELTHLLASSTGAFHCLAEMNKRNRVVLVSSMLVLAAVIGWIFRPYPVIDELKVHPALRGLDDSTKCVWTGFADGGSLAIRVTRADGSNVDLCMSNSLNHSFFERGQLYIGATHFSMPGAVKITGYDHTKYVVAKLLARDLPKHPNLRGDIAILTKRVSDWVIFTVHADPSEVFEAL
jgi:hypothetical protein